MQLLSLATDVFSTLKLVEVLIGITAVWIEPDTVDGEVFSHRGETDRHFLYAGDTRGMNVVETWTESSSKGFTFKDIKKFQI
jgi:hypothetical protein